MKLNRKWFMVIALVLSMAVATGGTLAYLMDTDEATNTFTIGNVEIDLIEDGWVEGSTPTLLPGVEIPKKPYIENIGNTDAWVWMSIELPTTLYESDDVEIDWNTEYWDITAASKDEDSTTTIVTLKQKNPDALAKAEKTEEAFSKVSIPATVEDLSELGSGNIDIKVTAYAVQADDTINSLEKAIKAFNHEPVEDEINVGDDDSVTYEISTDAYRVATSDELKTAIVNGETSILLEAGEYNWSGTAAYVKGKTLNLYGESKDAVIYHTFEGEANTDYDFDSATVNFYGLTISGEKNGIDYPGWARMGATYNDCVIKQTYGLYANNHTFNYCTFETTGNQYSIWTWGAQKAEFNRCTFNTDGKAILLYGTASTDLTLNDCLFNDKGGLDSKKAAVEVGSGHNTTKSLTVTNTKVNGYEINDEGLNTGSTLWGNKNSMTQGELNVVVDGVDVY